MSYSGTSPKDSKGGCSPSHRSACCLHLQLSFGDTFCTSTKIPQRMYSSLSFAILKKRKPASWSPVCMCTHVWKRQEGHISLCRNQLWAMCFTHSSESHGLIMNPVWHLRQLPDQEADVQGNIRIDTSLPGHASFNHLKRSRHQWLRDFQLETIPLPVVQTQNGPRGQFPLLILYPTPVASPHPSTSVFTSIKWGQESLSQRVRVRIKLVNTVRLSKWGLVVLNSQ